MLIPEIETVVVTVRHCGSFQALADEVALVQITSSPTLMAATLTAGYRVAGWLNTLGARSFRRSLQASLIADAFFNRLRTNSQVQTFLSGIVPAVLGMSAAGCVSLAQSGLDSALSFGIATTAFLLMLRAKLNPVVILIACGGLQFAVAHYLF